MLRARPDAAPRGARDETLEIAVELGDRGRRARHVRLAQHLLSDSETGLVRFGRSARGKRREEARHRARYGIRRLDGWSVCGARQDLEARPADRRAERL